MSIIHSSAHPTPRRREAVPVQHARSDRLEMETREEPLQVPLPRVLLTLAICLVLSLLVDARGLVHAAHGMPLGTERSVALAVGGAALDLDGIIHLTWPWDQLAAARGYHEQPAAPPLLATGPVSPPATPVPVRHAVPARSCGTACHHPATHPAHPLWWHRVTKAAPLRLLVTGDSLTEYLAPDLVNEASAVAPVVGFPDTHYGTGLVRPDFVDWSVVARQQMQADRPRAVVVFMGGNDFQNMVAPNGSIIYSGTAAWTKEYARRAAVCLRIWSNGGRNRVYWLSMPPARDAAWSAHNREINTALRMAVRQVPGTVFLNILPPVTDHGRYADFVMVGGQEVLVREPDGIHFNAAGSDLVSHEVLTTLEREWKFGPYAAKAAGRR